MRVGALAEQSAAQSEAAHEERQHRGGGECRHAEDQAELAQPRGLVDQRTEAGAEQKRGNGRRRARHWLGILHWVEFLDGARNGATLVSPHECPSIRHLHPHNSPIEGAAIMAGIPSDKLKAAETALSQIERQFGKGSIMRLGAKEFAAISAISSGSIGVDAALGVGGVPRGRIVEIFGPESSGKTTLSLHVIAEAQRTGGLAAFIDADHALDAEYAKKLGVDIDNLLVSQPDSGEQALEIAEMLVRSNAIDVIVIDSVAALVPKAELEGEMGDSHVGLQARLMSQA